MAGVLEDHIKYLADATRVDAFRRAIAQTVRPDDVVVDVGTGTGVLALMACAAGASRVYAIEEGPIIGLARKIAAENGCDNRIIFVRGHSSRVELPEKADVLVSDLIGPFGYEAGLFETLTSACERLLKPTARIIPSTLRLFVAPLDSPGVRERLHFVDSRPAGFSMSALAQHAKKTAYHIYPPADALLSRGTEVLRYELPTKSMPIIDVTVTVEAARDGLIDAIAGWFDAELTPGVRMTNAPDAPGRLDRRVVVFPVTPAISVQPGDGISIALRLLTSDHVVRWRVTRLRAAADEASCEGSTLQGMLISREDLARYERCG